jgi:hypothetical protein
MKNRNWKQWYKWDGTFRCTGYKEGGAFYLVFMIYSKYITALRAVFFCKGGFHV